MIETIYRVHVDIEDGINFLLELQTYEEIDQQFSKDFSTATTNSFNAQTDGYNGSMFADFTNIIDAQHAELAMTELVTTYTQLIKEALIQDEIDLINMG